MGPYVTAVTDTTARVLWVTDANASDAEFGGLGGLYQPKDEAQLNRLKVQESSAPIAGRSEVLHTAVLGGLRPGQSYFYSLSSPAPGAHVTGSFRTAPTPGSRGPIKFLVYGDTRSFPDRHEAVARAMTREAPFAFVLTTGDLVSNGWMWELWKREVFDPAGELLRQAPMWPVRGNHEGDAESYTELFPGLANGGLYYSFDWGNAHFVVLDSGDQDEQPDPNMLLWLEKDLAASKAEWKFAAYHKPTFNVGGHASRWGGWDVWPILQKHGVDAVFSGHSHLYERFRPIGEKGEKPIIQIVTGGGGAPSAATQPSATLESAYDDLHYCVVELEGGTLRLTVRTPGGQVLDRMKVTKKDGVFDAETMGRVLSPAEAWEAIPVYPGQ